MKILQNCEGFSVVAKALLRVLLMVKSSAFGVVSWWCLLQGKLPTHAAGRTEDGKAFEASAVSFPVTTFLISQTQAAAEWCCSALQVTCIVALTALIAVSSRAGLNPCLLCCIQNCGFWH